MSCVTTVVFRDTDGDEFPVALAGDWTGANPCESAEATLRSLEAEGGLRPTWPVSVATVEYPRSAP